MMRSIQLHARLIRNLVVAILLTLTVGMVGVTFALPAQAAAPSQAMDATHTPGSMMGVGMSMAEMGGMMDEMMASMSMSGTMSGTMSMADMGQMHMMMGMMHQQMGQMQMMMGMGMMEPGMMGAGMMSEGMMNEGMSMAHMAQMTHMMGMMHQQMAMMHMMSGMMAGHMSGGMMGDGMMGEGMMGDDVKEQDAAPHDTHAAPQATTTAAPEVTTAAPGATPEAAATPTPTPAAAAPSNSHPDHPLAVAAQHATAGAVTVEVIPLVDEEILEIAFAVTLETHSVELNFDLAEQASLLIGDVEFAPTSWEPNAADGHHVAGTLSFTIDHPAHTEMGELGEVTLDLGEIDGRPVTLTFAVE